MSQRPHALRIDHLSLRYGDLTVIRDVSIDIEPGRFVTLLGPSGSGKTTLLMSVAGFTTPTSGRILLDGKDVTALPPEKRNFGMVFQGYALFPTMTVAENVWFPLRVRGVSRAQAQRAVKASLELVQMGHLAERSPSQLSGGQQQRVALARALVFEPSLLLLDEPLSALDRQLRADLQWELRALHRRLGATFINVTHDQEEALSMSDEIIILRNGMVEQIGSPAELYARPATRFVANFLGDSNFLTGHVASCDSDRLHLRIGSEMIVQQSSAPVAPDSEITLALRPENMSLAMEQPATVNALQGTITDAKFTGATHQVQVETALMGKMLVRAAANQAGLDLQPGRSIWIGWNPDAAVVVNDVA